MRTRLLEVSLEIPMEVTNDADLLSFFSEVFGPYCEVKYEQVELVVGEVEQVICHDPAIRIYAKGGTVPKLTIWLI